MFAESLKGLARLLAPFAVGLVVLGAAGAALASPLQFTFTSSTGPAASFVLDSTPNPAPANVSEFFFLMPNTPGTFDGTTNSDYVAFHGQDGQAGGAFEYRYFNGSDFIDHSYSGDKMYTGTNAAPTFTTGTYSLFDSGNPTSTNTLVIADASPGAPGPEVGLGLLPAIAALGGLWLTRQRWSRASIKVRAGG